MRMCLVQESQSLSACLHPRKTPFQESHHRWDVYSASTRSRRRWQERHSITSGFGIPLLKSSEHWTACLVKIWEVEVMVLLLLITSHAGSVNTASYCLGCTKNYAPTLQEDGKAPHCFVIKNNMEKCQGWKVEKILISLKQKEWKSPGRAENLFLPLLLLLQRL